MGNFLPDGYDIPSTTDQYMRLEQGSNRFRILEAPLVGWEWWAVNSDGSKTPLRASNDDPNIGEIPEGLEPDGDGRLKHFWAMKVWNYNANAVQILSLTQKTLLGAIKDLNENPDWGSPLEYDITITRKGEGLETQYGLQPSPKKELPEEIKKKADEVQVNLEALFEGGNPFEDSLPF